MTTPSSSRLAEHAWEHFEYRPAEPEPAAAALFHAVICIDHMNDSKGYCGALQAR